MTPPGTGVPRAGQLWPLVFLLPLTVFYARHKPSPTPKIMAAPSSAMPDTVTVSFISTELAGGGRMFHAVKPGAVDVTVSEALQLMQKSLSFSQALTKAVLSVAPAVFWETPPVSASTSGTTSFAFAVLPAPQLDGVAPDADTFRKHFACDGPEGVVHFTNIGKDAVLVSPCPVTPPTEANYGHLAAFLRTAPKEQQTRLWAVVGEQLDRRLREVGNDVPVWTSTSGLGVYWLHVRLDSRPKYYQHQPFKKWPRR